MRCPEGLDSPSATSVVSMAGAGALGLGAGGGLLARVDALNPAAASGTDSSALPPLLLPASAQ